MRQPLRTRAVAGFTAVELIFTVAVAAVLLAVAMPAFNEWIARMRMRSASETIHAGLQLARAEALVRNSRVRFALQSTGGWSAACVDLGPGCPATSPLHVRSGSEIGSGFTLAVNGTTIGADRIVTFNGRGVVDTSEPDRIAQIDLEIPTAKLAAAGQRSMRIVVSDFGRTRMCNPNAPVGSPTLC